MDGISGETPNPLNPNLHEPEALDANPSEPLAVVEEAIEKAEPVVSEPAVEPVVEESVAETVVEEPVVSEPVVEEPVMTTTVEESVATAVAEEPVEETVSKPAAADPLSRPMEKAPVIVAPTAEPKKKRKWPIAAAIICLFIAVCCGVTAVLLTLNKNSGDAVTMAINRLINGETPSNVAIDGKINFKVNDITSPISEVNIELDMESVYSSMINSSVANVTVATRNGGDATFEFDEVYGANGDLYFKVDGATEALQKIIDNIEYANPTVGEGANCANDLADNCLETIEEETSAAETLSLFMGVTTMLDGEWIRVSVDEIIEMSNKATESSDTSCLIDFMSSIKNNSHRVTGVYKNNQFIISDSENLPIARKNNPLYKVSIDDKKFISFVDDMQNIDLTKDLYACLGYENESVNNDNVAEDLKNLPDLYVEIDGNYNFTRLYLQTKTDDGGIEITADLDFNYPTNINVSEPVEYRDFSEVIQEIFSSLYELPNEEEEPVEVLQ